MSTVVKKILIVDDEEQIRFLLREYLEMIRGRYIFRYFEAANGEQALDIIRTERPVFDLVILDVDMPVVSGFTVLKSMKNDVSQKIRNIPVIMSTAHAEPEYVEEGVKLGVSDYIAKPVKSDVFLKKVKKMLHTY